MHVLAAGVSIPHPEKLKANIKGHNRREFGYAGEDAYFTRHGKNNVFGMGVADGVYMWKTAGIDSGAFSRLLMETTSHMVAAGHEDVLSGARPAGPAGGEGGVWLRSGLALCPTCSAGQPPKRLVTTAKQAVITTTLALQL